MTNGLYQRSSILSASSTGCQRITGLATAFDRTGTVKGDGKPEG